MALQNRIDAFGNMVAVNARGTIMGNRGGRIHDPATKTLTRRWASKHWICCEIVYKDWHRDVMSAGYTGLFFLDEVAALACGHRPCAFCRREDYKKFAACWRESFPQCNTPKVRDIDEVLHRERQVSGVGPLPILAAEIDTLPDGAMIAIGSNAFAMRHGFALPWSFEGYGTPIKLSNLNLNNASLLSAPALVKTLKAGYQPRWHISAGV